MGGDASAHMDPASVILRRGDATEGATRDVAAARRVLQSGHGGRGRGLPPEKDLLDLRMGRGRPRAEGALAIHFGYDSASTLFFKVFNKEGCRLECCPRGSGLRGTIAGAEPASGPADCSSSRSDDSWESSDSPEPSNTPESSDDSYVPPSTRRARSAAAASAWYRR